MPTTDPFADLGSDSTSTSAPAGSDPFADLGEGFDTKTGAPVAKPSIAERVKTFGKELPGVAGQLATYAAAGAAHLAPGARFIPGAGQIALAAGTTAKAIEDQSTITQLENIQKTVPQIDINAQTQDYFNKLRPGLSAKGWTDEHIMQEARQRASNAALGAQATRESLDQDIQNTRENINQLPGELVSNTVFFGAGPKVLGALGSGLAKVGINIVEKPAASVIGKAVGSVIRHGAAGATIGGLGIGAGRATDRALDAWAQGKSSAEIGQELVKGAKEGGVIGAKGGAILGAGLGAPLEIGGNALRLRAQARAQVMVDKLAADARDIADRSAAQVRERNVAIDKTATDFDPHAAQVPDGTDPVEAATTIIQQAHGEDAAMSEAGLRAATQIADRIKLYQDANEALQGNIVPTEMGPTQGRLSGVIPVGAEVTPEGGIAPGGAEPQAVQGPLGQRFQQVPPPGQVTPVEGLEGAVPPSAAPPEQVTLSGVHPEARPEPAARLNRPPLGPVANAAGVETPGVTEPNPRSLEPAAPAPVPVAAAPAPSVEGMDLVHRAISDAVTAGENGKALKLAEKYGLPVDKEVAQKAVNDLIAEGNHEGALKLAEKTGLRKAPEPTSGAKKTPAEPKPSTPKAETPKVEEKPAAGEVLKSPARSFGDLGVVEGSSHADAQEKAFAKFGEKTPAEQGERGYVTESGKFVTAAEGDKIAEAAGQVKPGATKSQSGTYSSQDLNFEKKGSASTERIEGAVTTREVQGPLNEAGWEVDENGKVKAQLYTPEGRVVVGRAPKEAQAIPESATEMGFVPEKPAEAAAAKLADETHANVTATDDGKGLKVQLGVKPGEVAKPGGPATALDRIVKTADEHGVRVETDLVPAGAPKGGKIPLEKLIPWYEARGFKVVESTRIPEGNLASAKLVREPIGTHQNEVATALEKTAAEAEKRINSKLGRVNSGFDPTLIGDYAIKLAADMFSRRLRSREEIDSWLVQQLGEAVRPFLDKIVAGAQKHFVRMFKETGSAEANLDELLSLHESGKYGMGWYERTSQWAKERFGDDSDMFLRFLAVTSANGQTESGAAMALKAFAQWKSGMPFEGFRGASMVGQLEKAVEGKGLGENTKIQNFLDALRGDPNAVVLDRWMMDALNLKDKGGQLKPTNYKIYEQVVRDLARENDMSPRQFQAAVWEGARVRSIQTKEMAGGRALATKTGSARPLEDLVDRKLGGLTPEQYIQDTHGHLKMMENLYQALKPVRTGIVKAADGSWEALPDAPNGHTFDPNTFEPAAHEGYVVSLVSNSTQRAHMYPARLLKFRDDVAPLIKELEAQGKKPTVGVWQESGPDGKPTGNFSIDLNVMMKDKGQALALGKLARNHEIAKLGKGGEWEQNLKTGYDPSVNGKQFLPPKEWTAREAWHKQQMNRARAFMKKAEEITPKPLFERMKSERGALGDVGTNPKHTAEKIMSTMVKHGGKVVSEQALNNARGGLGMDSFWISPDGDIIHLDQMHQQNARVVRKELGIPSVKGYEGAAHGAGSDVQALLNRGFIRTQASGSMIAFDLSTGITSEQRAVLKKALANHEDWAAAISNDKGALVKGMSSNMGDKSHHFLAAATKHNGSTE